MRSGITKEILEFLKSVGDANTESLLFTYSTSRVWKKFFEMQKNRYGLRPKKMPLEERQKIERQRFYVLLHKLKQDGLVERSNEDVRAEDNLWRLTKMGVIKLLNLKKLRVAPPPFYPKNIEKDHRKIFIFDIPERLKEYRIWLRQALNNMNFRMLQKSVWIGDIKFPEDFLQTLRKYNILKYIHIFVVSKEGTLSA